MLREHEVGFKTYDQSVISVGPNRYRFMPHNQVVKLGTDQYQNNLKLPSVKLDDAGMYICFVSDSSLTSAWTYKSVILKVTPLSLSLPRQEKGKSIITPVGRNYGSYYKILCTEAGRKKSK